MLRIADLVDDDAAKRDRVAAALKDPTQKHNRDHVDIIIALGMTREGFDWIWCEHALTVGYRSSLTEIVQIIGRATRDAPGKTRARFTNLIAEPDAARQDVTEAVNDTLNAIAASLLMEQILAPRFEFKPKALSSGPTQGFDYGEGGYNPEKCNVGFNEAQGRFEIEIKGLVTPASAEAQRICRHDLNEVIATFVQDRSTIERGMFDPELVPEELTQLRMGKIIKDRYPDLDETDQQAVRQHAVAALNLTQKARQIAVGEDDNSANTAFVDGVRRFIMDVRELDIDLIDRINPFGAAYAILSNPINEASLKQVEAAIAARRVNMTMEEARGLAKRALAFRQERGRLPSITAPDAWEKRMAEGIAYLARMKAEAETIADRQPCEDFDRFRPLFQQVQQQLGAALLQTRRFERKSEIAPGRFYILGGQKTYVAAMEPPFTNEQGKLDARLRVIFDNGTESNLLMRSLQKALQQDQAGRRIMEPSAGPLFSDEDAASGIVYVVRSQSDHPAVAAHRDLLHKIGVTGGDVARRVANARLDPTFLMADVEIVATYTLANINRTRLENLIHRLFGPARLDIEVNDRFGHPVTPREWFLVPRFVIDEAMERIRDGTITDYAYDAGSASLKRVAP